MKEGFWQDASNKEATRGEVLEKFRENRPKICLFLPGIDIACIKKIYCEGLIDYQMVFYIVEHDESIMQVIKNKIKELSADLFNQCKFFCCDLSEVPINDFIDFAFIDLMGNLTEKITFWLSSVYLPRCSPTNVTFYTLLKAYRNNKFMKRWRNNFDEKFDDESVYSDIVSCTMSLFREIYSKNGVIFDCSNIFEYKDKKLDSRGIDMIFFAIQLSDVLLDGGVMSLEQVAKEEERSMSLTQQERRQIQRRIVAYKAVGTRFKRRGLTAKAAWATRRMNELEKLLR